MASFSPQRGATVAVCCCVCVRAAHAPAALTHRRCGDDALGADAASLYMFALTVLTTCRCAVTESKRDAVSVCVNQNVFQSELHVGGPPKVIHHFGIVFI